MTVQKPQEFRRQLQTGQERGLRLRRAVAAVSLVGMASMAAVSLYQLGLLRHLPDPPWRRFDSDAVNASDTAYLHGVPDGTVSLSAHAGNVALAGYGDASRAEQQPWVPIAACLKAAAEAVVAGRYLFYQMPVVERRWCGYCIVDAVAHLGVFALTVPEAVHAARARPITARGIRQPFHLPAVR